MTCTLSLTSFTGSLRKPEFSAHRAGVGEGAGTERSSSLPPRRKENQSSLLQASDWTSTGRDDQRARPRRVCGHPQGDGDREGVGEVEKFRDMAETSNANCRDSWKALEDSGLSPGRGAGGS